MYCLYSQAKAKCAAKLAGSTEDDVNCGDTYTVDVRAIANGTSTEYPQVQLKYLLQICNYNDQKMSFGRQASRLKVWHKEAGVQSFDFQRSYSQNSNDLLLPGACISERDTIDVPTTIATYSMDSLLQGPLVNETHNVDGGFCFAYSFNTLEFKYDYGDGDCVLRVSIYKLCWQFSIQLKN